MFNHYSICLVNSIWSVISSTGSICPVYLVLAVGISPVLVLWDIVCSLWPFRSQMVRGRKLLWYWVLLVRKVAGIPRVCDLVVIVIAVWFIISSLYDSDSEEWCSSLAKRMRIKSLNRWSLFLLCSGISPSLVLAFFTPSLPLIQAIINRTAWSWSCSMSDISFLLLLLGSQQAAAAFLRCR